MHNLISVTTAAKMVGIHPNTLRRYIRRGQLTARLVVNNTFATGGPYHGIEMDHLAEFIQKYHKGEFPKPGRPFGTRKSRRAEPCQP
jgi:hypothetical protein